MRSIRDIVLSLLAVILAVVCAVLLVLLVLRFGSAEKSRKEVEAQLKDCDQKINRLESEKEDLSDQISRAREEIDALNEKLEQAQGPQAGLEETGQNGLTPEILESTASIAPGTVLPSAPDPQILEAYFLQMPIVEGDAVFERINGRSYRENPDIALSDLRYLKLLHYNFKHQVQVGEMVVNAQIAEMVLDIFLELYLSQYEVASVRLVDDYWTGDGESTDTASIEANNTSCFNYRNTTGSSTLSPHGMGMAIDINPQQNPYVRMNEYGQYQGTHENAIPYYDRTSGDPHVIVEGDRCYQAFITRGFSWGGSWSDPIDYQHFEM